MVSGYELNLRDYWGIFLKRKGLLIFSTLVIIFATAVYTRFQPLLYKARAIVKIDQREGEARSLFPRPYSSYQDELRDYEKQIISAPVVEKAVKASGLLPTASAEGSRSLFDSVMGNLSANLIENTNMIRVELVSDDPRKAALLVNKVIEVFKSENALQKNRRLHNVSEFIQAQLEKVSAKLEETEDRLRELTLRGVGSAASAITEKLAELESKRADVLTKFTEQHPDVLKIDETAAALKDQLKELPREEFEYSNLRRDSQINVKLYTLLKEKLQEAQIRASEQSDNVLVISPAVAPLEPFSPNKPRNYTIGVILGLIFAFTLAILFEHLDTSIGRIEDLEAITGVSVIGVIPYFVDKAACDLRARKRRSLLRPSPRRQKIERMQAQLATTQPKDSMFLEAFRILGANLQVIFGENGKIRGKAIVVTSANPQEGKSIVASNLSIIMAQMGYKTLLIDGDMRRSVVHKIFSLPEKEKGLSDLLTGKMDFESACRTTADLLLTKGQASDILKHAWLDNLHLLTAGTTFPNSPYLLNTDKMDLFLKDMRSRYDVIIIDSPPILAVSDTSFLIPKIDGVVFVYRAGMTSRIALRRAKMQAESAKSKGVIKGIVLNNVRPEVSTEAYYYYYCKKYYAEEKGR